MIPGRQMGKSRTVVRVAAKNAGIPLKVFDKLLDEYEYANPEVTKVFKKMDKETK